MEEKDPRSKGALKVGRHFECSRLEKELLAAAYEQLLPRVTVLVADPGVSRDSEPHLGDVWCRERTDRVKETAMGGRYA
jgi:hypothetical protein